MAETSSKLIKQILETIRERAEYALKQLQAAEEERSMRWICRECGYTAGRCPRCKNTLFEVAN
ncbi:MAG: hypothetical protein DMF31_10705 [Verrucomicrobia bacterium]|nr:MAG: hypothetical protein DMF31_10705 [Verrucomicrobiota bacterium]